MTDLRKKLEALFALPVSPEFASKLHEISWELRSQRGAHRSPVDRQPVRETQDQPDELDQIATLLSGEVTDEELEVIADLLAEDAPIVSPTHEHGDHPPGGRTTDAEAGGDIGAPGVLDREVRR